MIAATKTQWQAAVDRCTARAQEVGWATLVRQVRLDAWSVLGRTDRYVVRSHGRALQCPCPAGQREQVCWHYAAVYIRRAVDDAAGRVFQPRPSNHGQDAPLHERRERPHCEPEVELVIPSLSH